MVLQPQSAWSGAAAIIHRATDPGSSRSALPSSPPCCLQMCANHLASAFARLASAFQPFFRLRLGFMRRLDLVPPYGPPLFGDGVTHAARHPSSDPCHANTDTRCDRSCGFRFGHAIFRCMGDGWQQQHHDSNGDNTHVRNTHDREPHLFTGLAYRGTKLGQGDMPVLYALQSYRSVCRPQRNLLVKLDVGDAG